MMMRATLVLSLTLGVLGLSGHAAAQYFDDHIAVDQQFESPEFFALELRIGPYLPDGIEGVTATSDYDDEGPLLGLELDVLFLEIPYVGRFGVGGRIAWSVHGGNSVDMSGNRTDEELTFVAIPLTGFAVLRIDVLSRELGIPFIFAGKLGIDAIVWDQDKGDVDEADGVTYGLHWALQASLELDFFDRHAARSLDEEWGINHTFVFFEYMGMEAKGSPVVGDRTWSMGLGFIF